jgi:hypothetical protein
MLRVPLAKVLVLEFEGGAVVGITEIDEEAEEHVAFGLIRTALITSYGGS